MKTVTHFLIAIALIALFSGNVFAGACTGSFTACDEIKDSNGGGPGISGLKFSPNVNLAYNGAADAFAVGAWNSNGTRAYGVSSSEVGVYVSKAEVTAADGISIPAASAAYDSNWVVLGQ